MNLHDLLLLVVDCTTLIKLTDNKGRVICYKEKRDFDSFYSNCLVNYIYLCEDICTDSILLEINIDYEMRIKYAEKSK